MINPKFMLKVFNNTVKGLREKTEVWCHTCWGNPSQQRMFAKVQSYKPALELLNQVDADAITFEMKSSGGIDLEAVGKQITGMKVGIGVIDHHTLQIESPDEVADLVRTRPEAYSSGASDPVFGLRHGARRNEPPPRNLQDGVSGARSEQGSVKNWVCRRHSASPRIQSIR